MSRSGYSDDCDGWALIRWRGAVNSAINGARGQKMLRDLRDALDAMPVKELVANDLENSEGVCALGALGRMRGIDMTKLDPEDAAGVAEAFDIAYALAKEIVFENDEYGDDYEYVTVKVVGPLRPGYPDYGVRNPTVCFPNPKANAARWQRMRHWVEIHIIKQEAAA